MTESSVHVRFTNVSKRYGTSVTAVRSLNLDVMRGEFLTLLGPSGSGKTTALMMLAGFEEPTDGEIVVDGHRIDNVPPNRRGIGMVFQNYALFPHMTVAENLAFPLQVRRMGKAQIEERVSSVLDMVRLPGLGGRRPDQLSGGQQQRIAVARALIFEPALVLMDEPLGALDKQLREQMQYEIKDIHARLGVTFVYVTHDQTEALTMSDRIAVFNSGAIQQLSDPVTLYERPKTRFVASFIGENNHLDGKVEAVRGSHSVVRLHSGSTVNALSIGKDATKPGSAVVLSLRPERLSLISSETQVENALTAIISQIIYVGDHVRIVCAVDRVGQLIVKMPNNFAEHSLAVGATARLAWRTDDCLALDP